MARYIVADRFAMRIKLSPAFKNAGHEGDLLQRVVLDLLDNAPAADVVEVAKARWKGEGMGDYYCSLCQEIVSGNDFRYCPSCGARMDGGIK